MCLLSTGFEDYWKTLKKTWFFRNFKIHIWDFVPTLLAVQQQFTFDLLICIQMMSLKKEEKCNFRNATSPFLFLHCSHCRNKLPSTFGNVGSWWKVGEEVFVELECRVKEITGVSSLIAVGVSYINYSGMYFF